MRESFLQEFMCVPADDASAFIPYELIDGCMYPAGEEWEYTLDQARACTNPLYAGIDIGRVRDLTSLVIGREVGGHEPDPRNGVDLQGMMFSLQESILYPWIEACRRTCIDKTGLGMQFAERAGQRFGTSKVEGVGFSGPVKEDLAYPVRSAFEDKSVRIPFGDDALVADLRKIRKETTASGNIRFVADGDKDGHADRFWALGLAMHAGKSGGGFQFAPRPGGKRIWTNERSVQ